MKNSLDPARIQLVPQTSHYPKVVSTAPPRAAQETVLLIEDDADVRELVQKLLGFLGYQVLLAENGAAGLALYREHANTVLVVLTDMKMPAMHGAEVIQALRTINPSVRIVAMSGVLGEKTRVQEEPGRLAFLHKPMTKKDIVRAFQFVLENPAVPGGVEALRTGSDCSGSNLGAP